MRDAARVPAHVERRPRTSMRCARTIGPGRHRPEARRGGSEEEDHVSAAYALGREGRDGPALRPDGGVAGERHEGHGRRSPAGTTCRKMCPTWCSKRFLTLIKASTGLVVGGSVVDWPTNYHLPATNPNRPPPTSQKKRAVNGDRQSRRPCCPGGGPNAHVAPFTALPARSI